MATNALDLGIDIGSLDAVVMAGYPGSIASSWQRAGRAGRRQTASLAVMVASSTPLDQYIIEHPEYFFERSPEHAHINADNLEILINHLKCAVFELPIRDGEKFGPHDPAELCRFLADEAGLLHHSAGCWHWTSDTYPADAVSLRAVTCNPNPSNGNTPMKTAIILSWGQFRRLARYQIPNPTTAAMRAISMAAGRRSRSIP